VWGYVDTLGVKPGEVARFHVSSPAAYEFSVVRLGRSAILDRGTDTEADRADVELLDSSHHAEATEQSMSAGSYIYVDGPPIPDGPITLGTWLRLWRLPVIDTVQWAWFGLITDLDYPGACRFGLLVDHAARLAVYAGDGGIFRHADLHVTERLLRTRLGEWIHVAATITDQAVEAFVDGRRVYEARRAIPSSRPRANSRLRIGATAEGGAAADFLDGDLAAPFVAASVLSDAVLTEVAVDRGRRAVTDIIPRAMHAAWPLDEERGANVRDATENGRDGRIVQGGTWQIGGPAFDRSTASPGYAPATDADRGHGLRLSSDDVADCEWDVTDEWPVREDAPSGLYAGLVTLSGQDPAKALPIVFAVVRRTPRARDSVALLLATNTWLAYGRRPPNGVRIEGLAGSFYSKHINGQPFFHVATHAPLPGAHPFGFESARATRTRHSHLVRPERYAEAWLAAEGFPYELITDADLHEDPGLLSQFRVLLVVGHSEYWSDRAKDGVDAFLREGGRVVTLAGNALYWRTTFNESMTILESRKTGMGDDHRWLTPDDWGERWHSEDGKEGGSFPFVGRPAHEVVGLDSQGMIDDGTPTSFSSFTVLQPDHFLFREPQRVPITSEGTIGESNLNGPKASGYEFDVTARTLGLADNLPPGMVVLASAKGQRNIEWLGRDPYQGAEIIYWERPAGGEVFGAGSIGFTGALHVDPGVRALLRNVFVHFGVPSDSAT
jgi:hypothetical protein